MLVDEDGLVNLDQICSLIEAKPVDCIDSDNNVAGRQPTNEQPSKAIFQ